VGIFDNFRKMKKLIEFERKFPDFKPPVKQDNKDLKSNRPCLFGGSDMSIVLKSKINSVIKKQHKKV